MTMSAMDTGLEAAYETCRRMHRRHDPTYYWATRRLPADVRPATYALYGYVRTADQLVDGPRRPAAPGDRRAALDAWEAQVEHPAPPLARAGCPPRRAGGGGGPARAPGAPDRPRVRGRPDPPRAAARRTARLHALD